MQASYTVTISNLNMKSNGRFKCYKVHNLGSAILIAKTCLKHWGGFADIIGYNSHCKMIQHKCYAFRAEGVVEIDELAWRVLWEMAWNYKDEAPEAEERPTVTYNAYNIVVQEEPKKGLLAKAADWLKSKF